MNEILKGHYKHANSNRAFKKASHGLAKLYGFKPVYFIKDNFTKQHHQIYYQGHLCNIKIDCKLLAQLIIQLKDIHSYQNISQLKQSRYYKYVRIYGIAKYYHPRRLHYADNVRNKLSQLKNRRCRFSGTYIRFGRKKHGQTVLITNIYYKNQLMTNHVWMTATKSFRRLRSYLSPYTKVAFNARVKSYQKGQISKDFYKHIDYSLQLPTRVQILK